ncbi:MAG TPA: hypothetical protein PKI12_08680 [Bacteroidales bacterium]|nr:hypothetical protein [Bacteroidales bacterium]
MKFVCFLTLIFLFSFTAEAQQITLTGAIVIGRVEVMSYLVVYHCDNHNIISGYSVSDINGAGETKASITGNFNPKTRALNFEEKTIISTRSKTPVSEFCLMKVRGKLEKKNGNSVYTGKFSSFCSDPAVICDSGTLMLMTEKDIEKFAARINKSTGQAKPKPVIENYPEPAPLPEILVRKTIELAPESVTEFTLKSDFIQLDLVDDKYQDGDKVTVLENNARIVSGFEVTNRVKTMRFETGNQAEPLVITIRADDEGSIPPTTVKAVLRIGHESNVIQASLKKGQSVKLVLNRK